MKNLKLRWMAKKPGKPVEELIFDIVYENADDRAAKELKLAQTLVKGYVEVVWIGGEVKGLINEEALYESMEGNCGFLGNIIFIRDSVEGDDVWFGSLTNEDIRKIKAWTIAHSNDLHPGNGRVQVLSGQAADEYRRKLHEHQKIKQEEWESF